MTVKKLTFEGPNGVAQRVMLVDLNGDDYVAGSGGGGGATDDREIVTVTYRVSAAGTGYASGDVVTSNRVLDVDSATVTQVGTTIWYNETQGAALAAAPLAAHLSAAVDPALTDVQLRASAVVVSSLALGAIADAAAAADGTGDYSLIAAAKRALLNWADLLARIPALVSGRMPVLATATPGALTNRSGTITAGGAAQVLMVANTARLGFNVQNVSTGDLWVNTDGTAAATQPSFRLMPGGYFETPAGYGSAGAVSIFGATTGQAFTAREW